MAFELPPHASPEMLDELLGKFWCGRKKWGLPERCVKSLQAYDDYIGWLRYMLKDVSAENEVVDIHNVMLPDLRQAIMDGITRRREEKFTRRKAIYEKEVAARRKVIPPSSEAVSVLDFTV
jgi:hypothetical protein